MTQPIEVWVGQRSPSVADTISSAGVDFTGASVKLQMRLEGGSTLKIDAVATVVTEGVGSMQVQYDWASLDVDMAGRYQAWWRVTLSGGLAQDGDEFPVLIKAHDGTTSQITIDSIRNSVETGIVDSALQVILDDAVGQVEGRFGTDASRTERYAGGVQFLRLPRPALSITSIQEFNEQRYPLYTLQATDYDLQNNGRVLERLTRNTVWQYRYWSQIVDVTYVPQSEQIVRDRVTVDLVKLAVQYSGLQHEIIGGSRAGYQSESLDYLKERERLLAAVPAGRGFRFL